MKREMVEAIVSMTEYNRFSKGIFGWIGFKTYWLSYDNIERVAGETKWNFWKLTKYAIDGIIKMCIRDRFLKEQMSTYASENSIKMNSREKYKNKILDVYKKVSGK